MVYKDTVDYQPIPSQLISRIHYLIFLWNPKGFIFPVPLLIFFQNLYILPWLKKSFKFMVLIKIIGKFICGSKNWICSLLLMPPNQTQTLAQSFIITLQAQQNYPFLLKVVFWKSIFSPAEKRGGGGVGGIVGFMQLKKIPKLNLRGYCPQFW